MSIQSDPREQLTRRLLEVGESTTERNLSRQHPDEETLAQFCDGQLPENERQFVVTHLSECSECRLTVSAILRSEQEAPAAASAVSLPQRAAWYGNTRIMLAAAATVLLMVTVWLLRRPGGSAEQVAYLSAKGALLNGEFSRVESILNGAERDGAESDRLRSLRAQAKREISHPLALAAAGQLIDFGYDVGGVVARDPATLPHRKGLLEAEELLANANSSDLETLLNRGHLLLAEQKPKEALTEFQKIQQFAPQQSLVWLGSGIARFLLDEFDGAEEDFRKAYQLDRTNLAAQINLAMTLEEQGKAADAIAAWQEVLKRDLDVDLRRKIEANIERLKQERAN